MIATVLVTGGAGYIGIHTCKAPARAGRRPVAYDNPGLSHHGEDLTAAGALKRLPEGGASLPGKIGTGKRHAA